LQDYDSLDAAHAPGDLLALAAAELGETQISGDRTAIGL